MRIGKLLALLVLIGLFAVPLLAQVTTPINSQGTGGQPIAVTTAVKVLAAVAGRQHWALWFTGNAVCNLGGGPNATAAASPVPTASPSPGVGFLFSSGILYTELSYQMGSATANRELDCASDTGSTIYIYSWEE